MLKVAVLEQEGQVEEDRQGQPEKMRGMSVLMQERQKGHVQGQMQRQVQVQVEEDGQGPPEKLSKVAALKQQGQQGPEHASLNAQAHVQGQSQLEMFSNVTQQVQEGEQEQKQILILMQHLALHRRI